MKINDNLSLFSRLPAVPRTEMTLRPYQLDAIERVRALFVADAERKKRGEPPVARRVVMVAPCGCHRAGQHVLMHDGTTMAVEDVRVNHRLMGPDSQPRRVRDLHRGCQTMARISPIKGEPFVVNLDHVLTLVRMNDGWGKSGQITDVSVRDWMGWSRTQKSLHKLFRVAVDFEGTAAEMPLEPYFLGVVLGDGSIKFGSVGVSKGDPEILAECERQAEMFGLRARVDVSNRNGNTSTTVYLSGIPNHKNPIMARLEALGLRGTGSESKFVPPAYRVASRADRLEMLAGLMDTDGSLSKGGFDYISQSETLARDTVFIARSVGLAAYVKPCEKRDQNGRGGTYWRVSISGDCDMIPTRIPRKQAPPRRQIKSVLRTGFNIELLDEEDFYGFELDGDGRYLLDDFTVTHNSGKTICFANLACRTVERGGGVLILAHRRELVTQAYEKLTGPPSQGGCGLPVELVGVIMAQDRRRNSSAPIQVASIDTLAQRMRVAGAVDGRAPTAAELGFPRVRLVVVDECHRSLSESYAMVLALYPDAKIVGVTATAYRMDGRGLIEAYDAMVEVADVESLILAGYLVRTRAYSHPVKADLSEVKTASGGDYDEALLAAAMDRDVLIGNLVDHWLTHSGMARTIVFAASVEHSKHIAEQFNARGIPFEHVDGATPPETRRLALERLKRGELIGLSNFGLFTDGTDIPWVKCVVSARPTKAKAIAQQAIGRGMRTIPGVPEIRCMVLLDHAGWILRHGFPEAPQKNQLKGRDRNADPDAVTTKECPGCYAPIASNARECPNCGWLFGDEPAERSGPREEDGELAEFVVSESKKCRELSATIQRVAADCDAARGWKPGSTNRAIVVEFGKSRKDMTDVLELRQVLRWLTDGLFAKQYPTNDDMKRRGQLPVKGA